MSLSVDQITAKNFQKFYTALQPYLNGGAHAGFTPIGSIIAVMGTEAPMNYLKCDGTVYNIEDYPDLANYFKDQLGSKNFFGGNGTTTFAVPDLRGEFLRGTGTNSHTDQGSGANVGTHQDATEQTFIQVDNTGNGNAFVGVSKNISNTWAAAKYDSQPKFTQNRNVYTFNITKGTDSYGSDTPYTARPTNTSVLYCIAYKNVYLDVSDFGEVVDTNDIKEIVESNMPSARQEFIEYSTAEQIIGKWIDGQTLYQKTIDLGALPNNTTKNVSIGVNNIDSIISIDGTSIDKTNNTVHPIPHVYSTSANEDSIAIGKTNGVWAITILTHTNRSTYVGYVTLRYTKTTS